MKDLEKHEELEMFLLNEMRKIKVLDQIIFGGGTMLRLCFDLQRFSVDFDFYLKKESKAFKPWAKKITAMFETIGAQLTDHWEKRSTFLWEIKMPGYPRKLKTEIRKEIKESRHTEINIAHSRYSNYQVRMKTLTLEQMFHNKIEALCDRNEIRDCYDLEFLIMRGIGDLKTTPLKKLHIIRQRIENYSDQEFKAQLGSFLPAEERQRVLSSRFAYLKTKVREAWV